jgi:hypothetical protein
MKPKFIAQLIISLAGLAWFGYYLLSLWFNVSWRWELLVATIVGLPLVAILRRLIAIRDRRLLAAAKAGRGDRGFPLVWSFIFIVAIVLLVPLFNLLSEILFLAFASASLTGGFAFWFVLSWLKMMQERAGAGRAK